MTKASANERRHTMRREHLKEARRALGLSALALGERAGIKEEKIFQVERGRYLPTQAEARSWADALDMPAVVAFPELFTPAERGRP